MRLMRLRQAIEAEGNREGFAEGGRKRPRLNPFKAKDKMYALQDGEDDDDESLDDIPLSQRHRSRMMRIKREDGAMIKDEDGSMIKSEEGVMFKSENGKFWVKKEEELDEQDDRMSVKAEHGEEERELWEGKRNPEGRAPSVHMEGIIKSEHSALDHAPSSFTTAPIPLSGPVQCEIKTQPEQVPHSGAQYADASYYGAVKMDPGPKFNFSNYGSMQSSPAGPSNPGPFSFRTYGHTSVPFAPTHAQYHIKPENANNHGYITPFPNHSSMSRPNASGPFASIKPEDASDNTRAAPSSTLGSPFRLDMFNTALTSSLNHGSEAKSKSEYVDSAAGSPHIKDVVESDHNQGHPST